TQHPPGAHREFRALAPRGAQGGGLRRARCAARGARVPRRHRARRGARRRRGAPAPPGHGGTLQVRHARVLHRARSLSPDRKRQDIEARARRVGEERAHSARSGALEQQRKGVIMSIELKRIEEFALLTLNRPEALNALSFALIEDLGRSFDEVARTDARALLVTGAGTKAFCAGADIKELTGRSLVEQKRGAELGQRTFAKLERLPMPSIAVINGYAFGGGLELALACTLRVATRNAKMGLPEIKLGLIPGYGGTQRLPRAIGETRALEMIMTGRTVDANEAA